LFRQEIENDRKVALGSGIHLLAFNIGVAGQKAGLTERGPAALAASINTTHTVD
jgi:hypothetical protein